MDIVEVRRALDADGASRQDALWKQIIPPRFAEARLDNVEQPPPVLAEARRFADNPAGTLIAVGPPGTGKTFLAAAVAREAHDRGLTVAFCPLSSWLASQRPNGTPWQSTDPASSQLTVIDDLGAERRSDWVDEQLFVLVDERWRNMRATIVTGNFARPQQIADAVDPRVWDRLRDGARAVHLAGASRRRPATAA